jgi:hypothetical protein
VNVYLLAGLVIFLANLIPALAPPTWSILVFFVLTRHPASVALIVIGVIAAVTGRAFLALAFRRFRHWLPKGYVANMAAAGEAVTGTRGRSFAVLLLFLVSPLSSAQLFEAAGLMAKVKLRPLLIAFGVGRCVSYSVYVTGAHALQATSLGALFEKYLTSPQAIALEAALVIGLVALGNIKWSEPSKRAKRSKRAKQTEKA